MNVHYNILLNQEYQTGQAFQIFFFSHLKYLHVFREESTLKCCFLYLWDKLKRLCPYNKDIRLRYPAHKHHELRQNFPRSNSSIFPLDSSLFPWLLTLYIVFPLLLLLIVWTHWSMEGSLAKLLFEYVTGST